VNRQTESPGNTLATNGHPHFPLLDRVSSLLKKIKAWMGSPNYLWNFLMNSSTSGMPPWKIK